MRLQITLIVFTALAAVVSIPAVFIILLQVLEPSPISDSGEPFSVLTNPAKVGQYITYSVTRCVNDPFVSFPFIYGRAVELVGEDGQKGRIGLPNSTSVVTHSGCETLPLTVGPVPLQTPPGKYHMEGTVTSIGRFRLSPSTFLWRSESFEVVGNVPTN